MAKSVTGFSQGSFQNLDFEQATLVPFGNGYSAEDALPSWQAFIGTTPTPTVGLNSLALAATTISLIALPLPPIDGNYSVMLEGGVVEMGNVLTPESASISQTALIPVGTQSLLFKAAAQSGNGLLNINIGSQNVSYTALSSGPNYTLYGANISAWAGKTEELTFTASGSSSGINPWELDDISFSPNTVTPEPSTLALTALGGFLFGLWRRR